MLLCSVFQKCHEYVTLFSRFRDEDTVRRVRQDLIEHDYRTAQWDDDGRPRIETAEEEEDEKDRLRLTRFESESAGGRGAAPAEELRCCSEIGDDYARGLARGRLRCSWCSDDSCEAVDAMCATPRALRPATCTSRRLLAATASINTDLPRS
jgi:hypothetical protein